MNWLEQLQLRIPIVQAPIGNACTPALLSAVSDAGALGMFAGSWRTPEEMRRLIRETHDRTRRAFGVNLTLPWPDAQQKLLTVCMEEGVPAISLWWGDIRPFLRRLDGSGIVTMATVGTAEEAHQAEDSGVDVIVAQGREAGGHVWGHVATMPLIPAVVDRVSIPVIAAGGIGDARGIAAALCLGAAGAWIGTRFVATRESGAHPLYKQAIIAAAESDTIRSQIFDRGWPGVFHRTLQNNTVHMALASPDDRGSRPGAGDILGHTESGIPVPRYDDNEPLDGWDGDIAEMCLYAGQSCAVIRDIPPAGELVQRLWQEAGSTLEASRQRWTAT
jgi:nitronate monooxygenase